MRYSGRDLARDTYAEIDMQPAVRRKIVAPQPAQPMLREPVTQPSREEIASHYTANAVRSFARRYGHAPTEAQAARIASNAAEMVEAVYLILFPRERDA